jgi:hypothetical protein
MTRIYDYQNEKATSMHPWPQRDGMGREVCLALSAHDGGAGMQWIGLVVYVKHDAPPLSWDREEFITSGRDWSSEVFWVFIDQRYYSETR